MSLPASYEPPAFEFVAASTALGLFGWIMGRAVNAAVGTRQRPTAIGMLPRMLINAIVLFLLHTIFPWSVVYHVQNTIPGTVFCGAFFGAQQWAA